MTSKISTSLATICLNDECNSKAFSPFASNQGKFNTSLASKWQWLPPELGCFSAMPCRMLSPDPAYFWACFWATDIKPSAHTGAVFQSRRLLCRAITILCSLLASHQLTLWPLLTSLVGEWRGFDSLTTHGNKLCNSLGFGVYEQVISSLQAYSEYCWGTAALLPYVLPQLECQSQWASVHLHWRKSKWKSHGNRCCHWGCLAGQTALNRLHWSTLSCCIAVLLSCC